MSFLCSLALHGANLEGQFLPEASTDAPLANGRYRLFCTPLSAVFFFFNDTATTEIYTLARSSTSADTSTAVMAMLKLPISSRKAWPISA